MGCATVIGLLEESLHLGKISAEDLHVGDHAISTRAFVDAPHRSGLLSGGLMRNQALYS